MTMKRGVRPRPAVLRALGHAEPPQTIELRGETCMRVDVFKHDSWAATARYRGTRGDVVCKFNRVQSIFGLPMRWLGRWLARRERAMLTRLSDVRGIPAECGPVTSEGRVLPNAVAHDYVPGRPLARHDWPGDRFFVELLALLEQLHARGIAYVDLHKRENIIRGKDGRPYLIDFQVCFGLWSWLRNVPPLATVLRALQHLDRYCVAKHERRHRPHAAVLFTDKIDASRPWWIDVHRFFGVPLRRLRRLLLVALGIRDRRGKAFSEMHAEDAHRLAPRAA
jgi:hypothetical protein